MKEMNNRLPLYSIRIKKIGKKIWDTDEQEWWQCNTVNVTETGCGGEQWKEPKMKLLYEKLNMKAMVMAMSMENKQQDLVELVNGKLRDYNFTSGMADV